MDKKSILSDNPENLIKKYHQILLRNGISVEKIILFGSYARGIPKPWSDIDLCIVSKNFGKDSYSEMVRLKKLTSSIDSMIEPHPYNSKDLNDPYDPLAFEIRKTGKVVIQS